MRNQPHSILIVDDDEDTCELMPLLLKMNGEDYDITTCMTANAAEALIAKKHFDLFILDNWMSLGDGPELCRVIRKFDRKVPIVMYSGAGQKSARDRAMLSGADLYLVKPNDLEQLSISVNEFLMDRKIPAHDAIRIDTGIQTLALKTDIAYFLEAA